MYDGGGGSGVEKVTGLKTGARRANLYFVTPPPKKKYIYDNEISSIDHAICVRFIPSPYRSCIIIQDFKGEGGHFLHLWKIDCTSISVKGGENVFFAKFHTIFIELYHSGSPRVFKVFKSL